MWSLKQIQIAVVVALVCLPAVTRAEPTLSVDSGESNSLPTNYQLPTVVSGSMEAKFNKQDCDDGVSFTVKFNTTDLGGKKLFLFHGDDCQTENKCEDAGSYKELDGASGTYKYFIEDLAGDSCSGDGGTKIWLGLFDEIENKSNLATAWAAKPIVVEWDMTPPSAPTDVKALGGEKKVVVHWSSSGNDDDEAEDDDTASDSADEVDGSGSSYYVIYLKVADSVSTASDTGTGTDTSTGSETGSQTSSSTDTQSDSGTDSSKSGIVRATEIPCPSGGFAQGDAFDPEESSGYEKKSSMTSGDSVKGLENGATYKVAVVARDEYMNFSEISEVACAIPEETSGFFNEFGQGGGSVNGKLCFVATVAFGSQEHPTVDSLRTLRDEFLLEVPGGRAFVDAYATIGPFVALGLAEHPGALGLVRGVLSILAMLGSALIFLGPLGAASVLGLGLGGAVFACRRRALRRRSS